MKLKGRVDKRYPQIITAKALLRTWGRAVGRENGSGPGDWPGHSTSTPMLASEVEWELQVVSPTLKTAYGHFISVQVASGSNSRMAVRGGVCKLITRAEMMPTNGRCLLRTGNLGGCLPGHVPSYSRPHSLRLLSPLLQLITTWRGSIDSASDARMQRV